MVNCNSHIAVPFIKSWHYSCGLYGEQGGEAIHHSIKVMKSRYSHIKNEKDRLQYILNENIILVSPTAKNLKQFNFFLYG